MERTNQGGSILSFVIIGAVLAVLLIGGAYFVRQKTQVPADTTNAPAPVQKNEPAASGDTKTDAPAEESTRSDKHTDDSTSKAPEKTAGDTTPSETSADELPQTGPASTAMSVVVLGAVGYAGAAYMQSRRARSAALTSLL